MNAIELNHLTKRFKGFALEDVSLTLPMGCVMGLIGENGAGKSTTIRLILGMLKPDGGTVTVLGRDGKDVRLVKDDIGVVFDELGLYEGLTCIQVSRVMAGMFTRWDDGAYRRFLEAYRIPLDKGIGTFSRGMRMLLALAIALSHGARLLLLDEATSGLDPVARDSVTDTLNDFMRDDDHAMLLSSHIVSDLEKLCDYIAFLHGGKLMLCREKDELLSEYAILRCARDVWDGLEPSALHVRQSDYGVEAVVRRDSVPNDIPLSPVSVEELFVGMIREANEG